MSRIINEDCLTALRRLEDNSVDAVVTDSPYGLKFMGKKWDCDVPSVEIWKECYRVLKPGGYLLSFAGTRTQHRMACNIEDAGFEIRDMIGYLYSTKEAFQTLFETLNTEQKKLLQMALGGDGIMAWGFGSGFPKSLDVGKAVDNHKFKEWLIANPEQAEKYRNQLEEAQNSGADAVLHVMNKYKKMAGVEREVVGKYQLPDVADGKRKKEWDCKAVSDKSHFGASGQNILTRGLSAWEGWGTALKPALEPITMARKPIEGTVAANVLKWGTGGINIAACRVGAEPMSAVAKKGSRLSTVYSGGRNTNPDYIPHPQGRFPANFIHSGEPEVLELFPMTKSGKMNKNDILKKTSWINSLTSNYVRQEREPDSGSAARFFYVSKASKSERNKGCEGLAEKSSGVMKGSADGYLNTDNKIPLNRNHHPTVKPLKLMEYLVKLVTREGAVVLDPFAGSGTTGVACKNLNREYILIEREAEYCEIIQARLGSAVQTGFGHVAQRKIKSRLDC